MSLYQSLCSDNHEPSSGKQLSVLYISSAVRWAECSMLSIITFVSYPNMIIAAGGNLLLGTVITDLVFIRGNPF